MIDAEPAAIVESYQHSNGEPLFDLGLPRSSRSPNGRGSVSWTRPRSRLRLPTTRQLIKLRLMPYSASLAGSAVAVGGRRTAGRRFPDRTSHRVSPVPVRLRIGDPARLSACPMYLLKRRGCATVHDHGTGPHTPAADPAAEDPTQPARSRVHHREGGRPALTLHGPEAEPHSQSATAGIRRHSISAGSRWQNSLTSPPVTGTRKGSRSSS